MPLFTIAIPTWNRARYLEQNLAQLASELESVPEGLVQVLISDNCSTDDTEAVVNTAIQRGLAVRYIRNEENIGWGRNFAQCFALAAGTYVLLLGDDDLLSDGALGTILSAMQQREYGIIYIRPYGFENDFRAEFPGTYGNEAVFDDANEFLLAIGPGSTAISACIVNKTLLHGIALDARASGDLAHLHLVLNAALRAKHNLLISRYMVACKRNNSSNYQFGQVFVHEFWTTLDEHAGAGLHPGTVRRLEAAMLFNYYPLYLLQLVMQRAPDLDETYRHFSKRFARQPLFSAWLAPIAKLPRPLGIAWGAAATFVGRASSGDLRRGIAFARNRLLGAFRRG